MEAPQERAEGLARMGADLQQPLKLCHMGFNLDGSRRSLSPKAAASVSGNTARP